MARTAKLHRLTALAVRQYAQDDNAVTPLHGGGGLYLRKRNAAVYWTLRLTDPDTGAQQWHRLFPDDPQGCYPYRTLADARAEARRLWATRSDGVDPRTQRRRQIQAQREADLTARLAAERRVTVRTLFERWRATDLAPRTLADGRRLGRRDAGESAHAAFERRLFPRLGDVAAADVTRADLLTVLDAAKAQGRLRTANILLSEMKQMFRFAVAREIVPRNPLDTVSKRDVGGASVARDRTLSQVEILKLRDLLPTSGLQPRFVAAVWLVLATGVRVGELLGAAWADAGDDIARLKSLCDAQGSKLGLVDLDRRTWYLPEAKNQRDHLIHLSEFAMAQLREVRRLREWRQGSSLEPWLFPGTGDGPVNVKALGKQLTATASANPTGDCNVGRHRRQRCDCPVVAGPPTTCAGRRRPRWPGWGSAATSSTSASTTSSKAAFAEPTSATGAWASRSGLSTGSGRTGRNCCVAAPRLGHHLSTCRRRAPQRPGFVRRGIGRTLGHEGGACSPMRPPTCRPAGHSPLPPSLQAPDR